MKTLVIQPHLCLKYGQKPTHLFEVAYNSAYNTSTKAKLLIISNRSYSYLFVKVNLIPSINYKVSDDPLHGVNFNQKALQEGKHLAAFVGIHLL